MDDSVTTATRYYDRGYNCAQAVFCAYAPSLGIDAKTAYRLMEGFGGGFGGLQEVCGAFSAVCAIIGHHASDGGFKGESRLHTFRVIQDAARLFSQEYGSIKCLDILGGAKPKPFTCGKQVAFAASLVERMLSDPGISKPVPVLP